MINLHIEEQISKKAPLYCKYQKQILPQNAYIYLFDNGNVYIDCNHEPSNNISFDELYGRTITFPVSQYLSGKQIKELFEDEEVLTLLNQIHEGHSLEFRNQDPPIGKLTDEAKKVRDKLQNILDNLYGEIQVWNVSDWLFSSCSLFDHWNDNLTIEETVQILENEILDNEVIDGDIEETLLDAALYRFNTNKKLRKAHIEELLKRNLITKEDLND